MNILVLNYEFPPIGGGASPVSKDLAEEFISLGHKVTVVTMKYKDLPSQEVVNGIVVHRVKCLRTKAHVCYPWEQLTYLMAAYFQIKKMMKVEKFDIAHVHFIIPTGVLGLWMKKKYGIKYVITAHGSDVSGYNQKRFKALHKFLKKPWKKIVDSADAVISPSVYLTELMKKQLPDKEYELIPNGVDTELFKPETKEKIILVMCRLQESKGVQTVVRAISQIEDMDGWKLCVAGNGPYSETLETLVKELKIEERVQFLGWIENKSKEHVQLVGKAAIYVSASAFENCPVSVLEALSAKSRVILSDISAHRLLVDDRQCLFHVGDATTLAEKILSAMQDFSCDKEIEQPLPLGRKEVAMKYENLFKKVIN